MPANGEKPRKIRIIAVQRAIIRPLQPIIWRIIRVESPQIEAGSAPGPKRRLKALSDLDRRTRAGKAALALRDAITEDLGGDDALSAMQRAIVQNVAVLGAALDDLAVRYLAGEFESLEMSQYATLANAQRRLLADLGLERRAVDVTNNSLSAYLAARRNEAAPGQARDIEQEDAEPIGADAGAGP
jgi:hypothetical protein